MLSTTCQYALRALAHLASTPPHKLVLGRELATHTGIPKNYLSKILVSLGNEGMIEAVRGSGGGYRLISSPHQISLMQVAALFDRQVSRSACLLGLRPVCSDGDPCTAHNAWRHTKDVFFEFLEETTLADICGEKQHAAILRPTERRGLPKGANRRSW